MVDIHSGVMCLVTSQWFFESAKEQLPNLVKEYYNCINKKVKRIQFYSDFYNLNGDYPYIKNNLVYYPLSIIFYNNTYEVLWISWECLGRSKEEIYKLPFCPLKNIVFSICNEDEVETNFKNDIAGKKLVYLKSKYKPIPVIHISKSTSIGKVNQAFVDVLVEQIERILGDIWNISLSNRWDVNVCAEEKTILVDNKKYRKVTMIDSIGYAITFGTTWQENFDVMDFVAYDEINFSLVDSIPGEKDVSSIKKLLDFIKERTAVNTPTQPVKWGLGIWTKNNKDQSVDDELSGDGNVKVKSKR